jgi:multidrug efflux pump subunit AcrA (membrane-fusion protein)
MPELATSLPCHRSELIVRSLGDRGPYVVKDPRSGSYYQFGEEEHFLLTQLDGRRDSETIRAAFEERFGQPLAEEEFQEFLDMAKARKLLLPQNGESESPDKPDYQEADRLLSPGLGAAGAPLGLRLLYWRKNFFDPDRLFTWLAPKIWWFWTPAFLVFSAGCIVLAAFILWSNGQSLAGSFLSALRWETAVLAWLVLMFVTTCHEFAHGLTCKHHGGEVHEVGFLLIFFMPCFYCNVSDAWLFREKSKRLWVTLAGGYFELFLWALAVFVWRVTTPDSLINYLAFVVLSACGVQTLFNFNPLLKLDGYYLLSDWMEVPNLQQRSADYVKGLIRWLLWGAARPVDSWHDSDSRRIHRSLLIYGLISWLYSLSFLGLTLIVFSHFLGARWGLLGLAGAAMLGLLSLRGLFHGFTAGEVRKMILFRRKRTVLWALTVGAVVAAFYFVQIEDRVGGTFQLRPATHAEIRAPLAGFVQSISSDEGDRISSGALLARLEVPDLESRLGQKRAEVGEVQAKLKLLRIGSRPEEVAEQRQRTTRAKAWRELAEQDLKRIRKAHDDNQDQLDKQIAAAAAERDVARDNYERAKVLLRRQALSEQELREAEGKFRVSQAHLAEAESAKRAHQAKGTVEAEAEVAKRDKELADAQAALRLLEAGTRPEEIQSEEARLTRLQEEVRHLESQRKKQAVASPVAGLVITPRLKEKVGQYVHEGDLICVVEEPAGLEAEISLGEQDVARIRAGQSVELKARALPFETYATRVDRVAPAAGHGDVQSTVIVYCRITEENHELRPGMTGYARIYTGRRSVGRILVERTLRFIRTEFWW